MTPKPNYATLEAHIATELLATLLPTLELEPAGDDADLQQRGATTFSFATTGRVSRLQRAGILAIHFYATNPAAVLGIAYSIRVGIEDALSASEGMNYTITACQFDTRLPLIDEDTREFINVECTYNIGYTIRRAYPWSKKHSLTGCCWSRKQKPAT